MSWSFNLYMWPFVLAVVVQLYALTRGWRARRQTVGRYYLIFMGACLGWTLGHFLEYGVGNIETAYLALRLQYLFSPFIAPFFFLFVMHVVGYGHRIPRKVVVALLLFALSIVIIAETNHLHHLHVGSLSFIHKAPYAAMRWEGGPLIYPDFAVGALLPLLGSVFALRFSLQNYAMLRRRAIITAAATLLPVIGFLLYLFGGIPLASYNVTPILLTLTAVLFARSIRLHRLLDIVPVARHQVVEQMAQGVIVLDSELNIVDCNPAAGRILETSRESLLGEAPGRIAGTVPLLARILDPETDADTISVNGRYYQAQKARMGLRRQQGLVVTISDISLMKEAEEALMRSNEELEQIVSFRTDALRRANRTLSKEIEERRRAEQIKKKLESKLKIKDRLEALGTFTSGIAHDFNNILFSVSGYADFALSQPHLHPDAADAIEEIRSAASQGAALIRQILTFSRGVDPEIKPVNAAGIIEEVALLLKKRCADARVVLELDLAACPPMAADATQLGQVILNLATNAIQAMDSDERRITIALRPDRFLADAGVPNSGSFAEITVSDTGKGIEPALVERIFDPFFSTKKEHGGTGLGLSVVHGIVSAHGGTIRVESRVGEGTRFTVRLPLMSRDLATELKRDSVGAFASGQGISVLFVDDQRPLRSLAQRVLSPKGFLVDTAESAEEALLALEHSDYNILITDVDMPGMSGLDLLVALQARGARLPVIVMSGDANIAIDAGISAHFGVRTIAKPIRLSDLSQCICQMVPPPCLTNAPDVVHC